MTASAGHSRLIGARLLLEYEIGDFNLGEAYLGRLLEVMRLTPPAPTAAYSVAAMVIPMIGRISGGVNRLPAAQTAAATVIMSPVAFPMVTMEARAGLALMAVQRGDFAAAREQYAALESVRGIMMIHVSIDRVLGLLAHTMSHLDQAETHFEDAMAFCRKAGFRPELAWTCCDHADALRERDGTGDKEKAVALLDESLAISSELGMRPLMERVLSRREILGS